MEQLRQAAEVLGSIKAYMVFRNEIRINQRQCCLLVDAYTSAFEGIADEIRHNLRFEEKYTKWNALESPLRELQRVFREGEQYIKQCLETKDWWAKAVALNQNTDCIDFHLHNLLWCVSIVLEAIENASEISGCDHESIYKTRLILTKKYEKEWMDPKLFQLKFGKNYLVSQEVCTRLDSAAKEDRWILSETISAKRNMMLSKHENQLADLLLSPKGKIFPSSILLGSKDYQMKKRIGTGRQYKEIQWMGECFAVKHFFGEIEPSLNEISLLTSVAHPNVMHYMYAFSDEERKECFLVMELMNKDLSSYIKEICSTRKRIPFPLLVAVDIMLQIARGMEYLHSRKIYHGDLNPSNILVRTRNSSPDGYLHAKVTGFGLANAKNSKNMNTYPCIWYAPEVLAEKEQLVDSSTCKCSEKADVYSFGMICFELLTGKIPFEDDHLQGEKMSRNIRAGERPLFPFPSPKYLTSLTKRCWQADPTQRPSFSSICRVLRYIKRFLIMNPDHNQIDFPSPPVDYFDLEVSLSKKFPSWVTAEALKVSEIPFQMFAYRMIEREKTSVNLKERSSESGSEGASICGDENLFNMMIHEDSLPSPITLLRSPSQASSDSSRRASAKKGDGKANKQTGLQQKIKAIKPPQLLTLRGRSMRVNSEHTLQHVAKSPGRRRASGHVSDSELT